MRKLQAGTMLPSLCASGRLAPIIRGGGWKAAVARLGAAVLLAGGLTVGTGGLAQAGTLHCGQVITVDTRLTSDLVGCPDNGIVIGADNITLDLNGHVIAGDGKPVTSCPPDADCDTGVDNNTAGAYSHVTITGGSIRRFDVGVLVGGPSTAGHISHLAVSHTSTVGILVAESTKPVVDHNVIRDPGVVAVVLVTSAKPLLASNVASGATGYAVFLRDDTNGRIVRNRLTTSEGGFAVGGTHNLVRGNVVTNSLGSIDVFDGAVSTRVEFNRLSHVGDGVIVGVASHTLVAHNLINRTGGDDRGGFGVILDGSADDSPGVLLPWSHLLVSVASRVRSAHRGSTAAVVPGHGCPRMALDCLGRKRARR